MTSLLYTLDGSNNPVAIDHTDPGNAIAWGEWRLANHKQCVVAQDPVRDADGALRYGISTVFTGMSGDQPPLLWETVVQRVGVTDDEGCSCYATYASHVEAEVGHQRALAYYREAVAQTSEGS